MNNLEIILLPAGLVMLCYAVYHIISYPHAVRQTLAFQHTDTLRDVCMTILLWFEVLYALATVVYLIFKLFII